MIYTVIGEIRLHVYDVLIRDIFVLEFCETIMHRIQYLVVENETLLSEIRDYSEIPW